MWYNTAKESFRGALIMNLWDGGQSILFMRVLFLIVTLLYLTDLFFMVPKYTRCKYDHTPRKQKLMWKGACIGVPVVAIIVGTVFNAPKGLEIGDFLLIAGMCVCAVGDIVLEIKFIRGGFLFFAGHLLYIAALASMTKYYNPVALIIYVVLAAAGWILTNKHLSKKYRILLVGYNLTISASFALGVNLLMGGDSAFLILGAGVMLLPISDWLMARNKVFGSTYAWSLLALVTYFGGQILISAYPYLK